MPANSFVILKRFKNTIKVSFLLRQTTTKHRDYQPKPDSSKNPFCGAGGTKRY